MMTFEKVIFPKKSTYDPLWTFLNFRFFQLCTAITFQFSISLVPKDGQFSGEYICYDFAIWRPRNMSKTIKKLFSSFFMKKSLLVKQCCIFKVVLHINRKRIFFCTYWPNVTFQVCSKDELWLKKVIFYFHQWQKLNFIAVFLKVE
jgi:hypothetical protein